MQEGTQMFRLLALAIMLATLVNAPAMAETLNGGVSIDRNLEGAGDTQLNQDTPVPDAGQRTIYRPGMMITIRQYKTSQGDVERILQVLRENGLGAHFTNLRAQDALSDKSARMLNGNADQQLSALGLAWTYPSGRVSFVDPACDLAGKLVPGDVLLGIDGVPPLEAHSRGLNFGNAGEVVQLTFSHDGAVQTLPCKRQPIANFTQISQTMLNWGALKQ